jgi:PAS domain S-box-containing protein
MARYGPNLTDTTGYTVLNVDDTEASRYVKSRILRSAGYRVLEAGTGEDALRLAQELKPELVLLDVNLPGIDGLQVCQLLRSDPTTASMMILLDSAERVRLQDRVVGLERGADAYLLEPVAPDELLATVKALLRLYRSEQHLKLALDIAELASYAFDRATSTVSCDARLKRMLGLPPDAFVDSDTLLKALHPDDRGVMEAHMADANSPVGSIFESEFRLTGIEDGVERWIAVRNQPYMKEGQSAGFIGTAVDITKRKRAETAQRISAERKTALLELGDRLRELTNPSDLAFATAEILGKTLEVSRCGYGTIDLAAETITIERDWNAPGIKSLAGVLHFRDYGSYIEDLKRGETVIFADAEKDPRTVATAESLKAISAQSVVNMPVTEQGGFVALLYLNHATPREWTSDELSFIRDVAERTRIAVERRYAEERLRTFAGQLEQMVATRTGELLHSQARLRALTTELNLAEQRERKRLAAELHDHLAQMIVLGRLTLSQAKRITKVPSACIELIDRAEGILAESLTYTRTMVADLAPPVLHDLGLPTALKWLAEYMQRYQLSVTVELPQEERLVLPEDQAILLFQSVRELLLNASKYAGSPEVWVTLERSNDDLCLTVRDQGKGFDLGSLATVNAEQATTVASKFGLFSIRERMQTLGGKFDIQSSPGGGTTATLVLPLHEAVNPVVKDAWPGEAVSHQSSTVSSCTSTQPPALNLQDSPLLSSKVRVLLVDDHAMVRQGLRSVLESYKDVDIVGEASNGEEALATIERWRPSVVVMDINMPKKNGIEATTEIKARWPDTIVVGLSVNPGGANSRAMEKAGATLLLTKDAAVVELYQVIRQALAVNDEAKRNVKC